MFELNARTCLPGWSIDIPPVQPLAIHVVMGEGIGPEVIAATLDVLDAVASAYGCVFTLTCTDHVGTVGRWGRELDEEMTAFVAAAFATGAPLLSGPVGGRFVYELRSRFDLWCKWVPIRPIPELVDGSILRPERVEGTDVLVVRDNAGGLYQGSFGRRDDVAFQNAAYTVSQVDRVLTVAARAATARRGRLAVVTKPGGIPAISALWAERAAALAGPEVTVEVVEVDNACFQLVADPHRFDVVATPNMLGDIVADVAALVLGSRGLAVSANFGDGGRAIYQTGHGAAHDLAGRDVANPIAQIESLGLLLAESGGFHDAALGVRAAVASVVGEGVRTADIAGPGSTVVGTRDLGRRIAERVVTMAVVGSE